MGRLSAVKGDLVADKGSDLVELPGFSPGDDSGFFALIVEGTTVALEKSLEDRVLFGHSLLVQCHGGSGRRPANSSAEVRHVVCMSDLWINGRDESAGSMLLEWVSSWLHFRRNAISL